MGRSYLKISSLAIALGGMLVSTALTPALATTNSNTQSESSVLRQGLPGRRISGGSRSPNTACLAQPAASSHPVVALMPQSNQGKTVASRPTLWFSLPAVNTPRSVEFRLFDPEGYLIHQETFSTPEGAEITSVSLPDNAAPLTLNQNYRWTLSLVCNDENRAEDLGVSGWVKRVAPSETLLRQLSEAGPEEAMAIYERAGLWYDALTALAAMRRSPATPVAEQHWLAMIESLRFSENVASQIAIAPLGSELTPLAMAVPSAALPLP